MMNKLWTTSRALAICAALTAMIAGCVQAPTERQSISDLRPQISFKAADDRALSARVQLDGLDAGSVSDYVDGVSAMRIRPGTHTIRVIYGAEALLEEKFYLGDGANRAFIVR